MKRIFLSILIVFLNACAGRPPHFIDYQEGMKYITHKNLDSCIKLYSFHYNNKNYPIKFIASNNGELMVIYGDYGSDCACGGLHIASPLEGLIIEQQKEFYRTLAENLIGISAGAGLSSTTAGLAVGSATFSAGVAAASIAVVGMATELLKGPHFDYFSFWKYNDNHLILSKMIEYPIYYSYFCGSSGVTNAGNFGNLLYIPGFYKIFNIDSLEFIKFDKIKSHLGKDEDCEIYDAKNYPFIVFLCNDYEHEKQSFLIYNAKNEKVLTKIVVPKKLLADFLLLLPFHKKALVAFYKESEFKFSGIQNAYYIYAVDLQTGENREIFNIKTGNTWLNIFLEASNEIEGVLFQDLRVNKKETILSVLTSSKKEWKITNYDLESSRKISEILLPVTKFKFGAVWVPTAWDFFIDNRSIVIVTPNYVYLINAYTGENQILYAFPEEVKKLFFKKIYNTCLRNIVYDINQSLMFVPMGENFLVFDLKCMNISN